MHKSIQEYVILWKMCIQAPNIVTFSHIYGSRTFKMNDCRILRIGLILWYTLPAKDGSIPAYSHKINSERYLLRDRSEMKMKSNWMDNKKDLTYLISNEGKRNLIDVIVGGVEKYMSWFISPAPPWYMSHSFLYIRPYRNSLTFICR